MRRSSMWVYHPSGWITQKIIASGKTILGKIARQIINVGRLSMETDPDRYAFITSIPHACMPRRESDFPRSFFLTPAAP